MILVWLVICGFFRGAALINFTITISEYSSLEKLPAAFGLHMVGKGLFVVAIGPILGERGRRHSPTPATDFLLSMQES
jgi:MCP family monocarboxylic acid transporter-like MFS transporter 14